MSLSPTRFVSLHTAILAAVALLVVANSAVAASIFSYDFDDFSNGSTPPGMNLVGNAVITDDPGGGFFDQRLRLTFAAGGQNGSGWRSGLDLARFGFDTTFTFQISFQGGGGADGFSFNAQSLGNSINVGETGPGPGSLTVSFDMFQNAGDPSDNFIRIYSNGNDIAARNLYSDGINMSDGSVHTARVIYAPGDLDVIVDGITVLSNVNVDLNTAGALVFDDLTYLGFGGRTGGAVQNHDILTWNYTAVPEPSSIVLAGCAALGLLAFARLRITRR